jgi:hypothetical protein
MQPPRNREQLEQELKLILEVDFINLGTQKYDTLF